MIVPQNKNKNIEESTIKHIEKDSNDSWNTRFEFKIKKKKKKEKKLKWNYIK